MLFAPVAPSVAPSKRLSDGFAPPWTVLGGGRPGPLLCHNQGGSLGHGQCHRVEDAMAVYVNKLRDRSRLFYGRTPAAASYVRPDS
jgi:hypothetical protein